MMNGTMMITNNIILKTNPKMALTDKNGKEIKAGHELNVPLDVFASGFVTLKDNELSLELKYESTLVALRKLNKNIFSTMEIVNETFN